MQITNQIDDDLLRKSNQEEKYFQGVQGKYQWIIRIFTPLLFLGVLALNYTQGTSKNKQISDKFHLWTTPQGFFFIIWAVIYALVGISTFYNLVKNVWTLKAHFWFGMNNVFSIFWTIVFDYGELWTTALSSLLILCLTLSVFFLWLQLGNVEKQKINFWTYFMRNSYAFNLGWVIAATNLNFGMDIVYWWGATKQTQMIIFWIMAPACALGAFLFNTIKFGKFGLLSCLAVWVSVIWAFVGAAITSHECVNGTGSLC